MFKECVVCGTRTRERVTLIRTLEDVALCTERCQRMFLQYPWQFIQAENEVTTRAD
jgi:hypothetical protein